MECSRLVDELHRYCMLMKLLQKSLQDTRKTFKDINSAKCIIESQVVLAEMSPTEESVIHNVANSPPCIVVLGQSLQARVDVTNWIFGEDFLPAPGSTPWHTILFRYGARNRITALEETQSVSTKRHHFWKLSVPLGDLEIEEPVKACSAVDIRANHPLLRAGARVSVGSSVGDPIQSYQLCVRYTAPIVVFAVQGSCLTDEEITLLQYIRTTDHNLPIYFVKMLTSHGVADVHDPSDPALSLVTESGSPRLFRQLIELEFFTDSSQLSDTALSRPPSEVENSLNETIRPIASSNIVTNPGSFHTAQNDQQEHGEIPLAGKSELSDNGDHNMLLAFDHIRDNAMIKTQSITGTSSAGKNPKELFGSDKSNNGSDTNTYLHPASPASLPAEAAASALTAACSKSVLDVIGVDQPLSEFDNESCIAVADSEFVEGLSDSFCSCLATFARGILQTRLVSTVALLYTAHRRCLETLISLAFDMAWDVVCTPTRLRFARIKEEELYNSLMRVALKKQDEIKQIIVDTIASEQESVLQCASMHQFTGTDSLNDGEEVKQYTVEHVRDCTTQIQELVIARLNAAISCKLLTLVSVLHDSYTGVLTRCLASLEQKDIESSKSTETSDALKEILNAAYNVEITACSGASFVKTLIEKMKQLMHGVLLRTPSSLDDAWKRRVASNVLSSLTETRCQRLAKSICAQIKDRVRRSHVIFETSLQRLEVHHNGRLQQTEKQRLHVRKEYAPRIARLALESRSLRDLVLYGKPLLGPEVGRGQYGVVYSCESWAGFGPCAVKSVAPPDDRHWNDLALEFHYTTNIPEHHRIVSLRGSIIDYTYGSGSSRNPAVLLIMDRFKCDLYAAIEQHMNWLSRLQVAVDVVEGIRYLHAQGLVHRDIKLKNVLLDTDNRGRLTDLGFCKPEAMMSGSIVGTPLHMAPELVTGKYDHSVDVYAFGVLFWYICAGTVRLPTHFEVCTNKDMLFTLVRKGLRPERPPDCDRDCWELMNRCWDGEPVRRPHVGELELSLRSIYDRVVAHNASLSAAAAGTTDQQTGASHVGTTPEDLIEVELVESLTTDDSELDFDDLTLQ